MSTAEELFGLETGEWAHAYDDDKNHSFSAVITQVAGNTIQVEGHGTFTFLKYDNGYDWTDENSGNSYCIWFGPDGPDADEHGIW